MYDGSATTETRNYSINDCLLTGPNLIPQIFDLLVKFRQNPVGLVADIEKAFLMIGISEEDRDMLRFLWLKDAKDPHSEILKLRFCRLVFGLRSSPAVLGATIQQHLETHERDNPEVVEHLRKSLYVDDFVSGAENDERALDIYKRSKQIMCSGGFNLRKWSSNSENLIKCIDVLEGGSEATSTEPKQVMVLGMAWDTAEDTFLFNLEELIEYAKSLPVTKRSLLRWSSKIFDPLGFLSPFTIRLKILFQMMCMNKIDWDGELQGDLRKQWNTLISELKYVSVKMLLSHDFFSSHHSDSRIQRCVPACDWRSCLHENSLRYRSHRHEVTRNDGQYNVLDVHKIMDINRFSSLKKLLRVTAYVLRFIEALKTKKQDQPPTVQTIKQPTGSEITIHYHQEMCVICRKAEGSPYDATTPPDLPASRVSEAPPFTNEGLDMAGPRFVREDHDKERSSENSIKVYVLLFTCASTRAVHLELTPSLSVSAFLRAFRRYASRRGLPALLISDNAKTFRASCAEIRRLCRCQEVLRYLVDNQITWQFIVEKAPWWGGFWERLIRSVKRPLRRVIGRANLTYDEL